MRRWDAERGFSLIEVMVVMMILAVLVTISLAAYGRFEQRAEDGHAQSSLRHAMLAQQAIFADTDAFSDVPADFTNFEPEVFVNTSSASDFGVYVEKASDKVVCLQEDGGGGKVLAVWLSATSAPEYGRFTDQATADLFTCPLASPSWSTQGW